LTAPPLGRREAPLAAAARPATIGSVPVIDTDGLTKRYGASRGIEDVTMSVEKGEVFGFLGPNGAGKTTTIRTLLDLLHPTSGSARVFGLDSRRDSVAIRARLGNLPGDFGYGGTATGREAVRLLARLRGMSSLGRAEALASRFQADLDRPLAQLSRGNRQKVGLILAAFHSPELLILDEPTSGLDPLMQEEFLTLAAEERERGCTVFISSHELDEVERVCDRVGIIRDGRLIATERVTELTHRAYRRVAVELAEAEPLDGLGQLPGVSDIAIEGSRVTFRASGDLDAVVKALADHHVVDVEIAHPTLEEVFLTYYGEGAGDR
jgi:ABC-2 type transport system ATP-binding protein